jgi:hypothetical protein
MVLRSRLRGVGQEFGGWGESLTLYQKDKMTKTKGEKPDGKLLRRYTQQLFCGEE